MRSDLAWPSGDACPRAGPPTKAELVPGCLVAAGLSVPHSEPSVHCSSQQGQLNKLSSPRDWLQRDTEVHPCRVGSGQACGRWSETSPSPSSFPPEACIRTGLLNTPPSAVCVCIFGTYSLERVGAWGRPYEAETWEGHLTQRRPAGYRQPAVGSAEFAKSEGSRT